MTEDELRERVKRERELRGLSLKRAARLAGADFASDQAWGNWESGTSKLTPYMVRTIANAFEWPMDWPENPPPPFTSDVTQRVAELENDVRSLRAEIAALRGDVTALLGVGSRPGSSPEDQRQGAERP